MAILGRIFLLFLAYALACVAASLVLTIGTLTPDWDELAALGLQSPAVWVVVMIGAAVIGAVAMLPAALIIALAEGLAWRSVVVYAALGGTLALVLCYGIDFTGYASDPDGFMAREREVLAAAGIAGGLVYWLFAGRRASAWS